jgi:6-phospho-3-hexuloisomerase
MSKKYDLILNEIKHVLDSSSFEQLDQILFEVLNADHVLLFGLGRVGYALKSFALRLHHLGKKSYFIGDIGVPRLKKNDLLIIASGSGTSPTSLTITKVAKENELKIICLTTNIDSPIANLSDLKLHFKCNSKNDKLIDRGTIQPMTTLFEQSIYVFLDCLVLDLMELTGQDHFKMLERHNVIE